jgi:hypothetical protein
VLTFFTDAPTKFITLVCHREVLMSNRVALRFLLLSLGGIALVVGCNDEEVVAPGSSLADIQGAAHFPYQLQDIPENELWDRGYYLVDLAALDTTFFRLDADGVMMVKVDGIFYYNPVTLSNYGLALVDDYDRPGNSLPGQRQKIPPTA